MYWIFSWGFYTVVLMIKLTTIPIYILSKDL